MPFTKNGSDLDTIFEPRGTSNKRADVGYQESGTDISNLYYSLTEGGTSPANTGFQVEGSDLANYFAGIGTVSYGFPDPSLLILGEDGPVDDTGTHSMSAGPQAWTSDKKCGTASLLFIGTGSTITPSGDSLDFGAGNFTIDFWVKTGQLNMDIFSSIEGSGNSGMLIRSQAEQTGGDVPTPGYLRLQLRSGFNDFYYSDAPSMFILVNQWNHIALIRSSANDVHFAINGTRFQLASLGGADIPYNGSTFLFGGSMPSMSMIDHFRVTKGEALWTSDFSLTDGDLGYDPGTLV